MYIAYKNRQWEKICTNLKSANKHLGKAELSAKLMRRLRMLAAFECLADVPNEPPWRKHPLIGGRKGQWAVDFDYKHRICLIPSGDFEADGTGAPILETVTSIEIVYVGNYHD